jgi:hypothetical protein
MSDDESPQTRQAAIRGTVPILVSSKMGLSPLGRLWVVRAQEHVRPPLHETAGGPFLRAVAVRALTAIALMALGASGQSVAEEAPGKPAATAAKRAVSNGPTLLSEALTGPLRGCEKVLFAARTKGTDGHYYANFGYRAQDPKTNFYGECGQLCLIDLRTGKLEVLIDDPRGAIRDPAVHYDGRTVVFSWRRGGSDHYNLYELDLERFSRAALDAALAAKIQAAAEPPQDAPGGPAGQRNESPAAGNVPGLRQLTFGPWDDIESCWLPNDDIVFCSSRCKRWVNCFVSEVAILYRCDRNGGNIRPISANIAVENTPSVLPDGRVLYTRWEYVDRSHMGYHHLWTSNPDGTAVMTYFGNMSHGTTMIDAMPLPGTDAVACIFSGGHGDNEHRGNLTIVRPQMGPDDGRGNRTVPGLPRGLRDPFPIDSRWLLVAQEKNLLLVDAEAGRSAVAYCYAGSGELMEPRLVRPRPREKIIPDRVDNHRPTGTLFLVDVRHGRNMAEVQPGEIRKLLVVETLPKPVNFAAGCLPLTWRLGSSYTIERLVGTVPVEPDGSAYFELPANRPFFFVALDAHDMSIKRMQSFMAVMPGETFGCVGCHERRTHTARPKERPLALGRQASKVEPIAGIPDVIDFPRDVQPILDRHCLTCHDFTAGAPAAGEAAGARPQQAQRYGPRSGNVILSGDRTPMYSFAWFSLFAAGQVADGRNGPGNRAPRTIGSSASPLMQKIDGSHHNVRLSANEWRTIWAWIETGATYSGTYACLGTGTVGSPRPAGVLNRRCNGCHSRPALQLPANDVRVPTVSRHEGMLRRGTDALYNLTRPEMSPILLAPLAKAAGGWADGPDAPHAPPARPADLKAMPVVFRTTDDPDYQAILAEIRKGKEALDRIKRFDMPGFQPNEGYIREMKRYGILPASFTPNENPIDPYQLDRAYWKSFWCKSQP